MSSKKRAEKSKTSASKKPSLYKRIWAFVLYVDFVAIFLLSIAYNGFRYMSALNPSPQTEAFMHTINSIFPIIIIFIAVFNTFFGLKTLTPTRKGFREMSSIMTTLAVGNLEFNINNQVFKEFDDLAKDALLLRDSTRQQADSNVMVAHGDLTVDIVPRSNMDALSLCMREMVQKNAMALISIREAIEQVSIGADEVAKASDGLAAGSTEQASAIEQITASIMDVAEKTKINAEQASAASDLVAEALRNVEVGNDHMNEMVTAMTEINASSESIYKIIKVIDDIAFQTNILALNAAVEAARAGEAGKGFSVVAEEVRSLAAKSAQAAAETTELIEDTIAKVNAGSRIAEESSNALDIITINVEKSAELIQNIAEASNIQATAIAEIDSAIEQVSQVVQTNSATSSECAASSEELAAQAVAMREQLAVYKLPENVTFDVVVPDVYKERLQQEEAAAKEDME